MNSSLLLTNLYLSTRWWNPNWSTKLRHLHVSIEKFLELVSLGSLMAFFMLHSMPIHDDVPCSTFCPDMLTVCRQKIGIPCIIRLVSTMASRLIDIKWVLATNVCEHNTVVDARARWSVICLDCKAFQVSRYRGTIFFSLAGWTVKVTPLNTIDTWPDYL